MADCLHQNMTFSCDQKLKSQVSYAFGNDDLFRLLADSEVDVVMKMLGLLRNLLSSRSVKLQCCLSQMTLICCLFVVMFQFPQLCCSCASIWNMLFSDILIFFSICYFHHHLKTFFCNLASRPFQSPLHLQHLRFSGFPAHAACYTNLLTYSKFDRFYVIRQ